MRIGSRAACRVAGERLRSASEKALDDAVFEGMEADHGKTAAASQQRYDGRKGRCELRQLPVHENPKGLERARGRILTPITPRARADGFGHDLRKLPRADDGLPRARRRNCSCNRLSKPFFTIVADDLRQFARGRAGKELARRTRRGTDPFSCRAVRRSEKRSRARHRRSAARRFRDRRGRRRPSRGQARRGRPAASENHARRKTKRESRSAPAAATASGSRSMATRRPCGPSLASIAAA